MRSRPPLSPRREPRAFRHELDDDRGGYVREDFGQADYSTDYAYDPDRRVGYRWADEAARRDREASIDRRETYDDLVDHRHRDEAYERRESRSWFGSSERRDSDRVLWAAVSSRLDHARGIDLSDIDIEVRDAEVILNGTVRSREEKRRVEDLADVRGVRDVHNHLRIRERGGWMRSLGF